MTQYSKKYRQHMGYDDPILQSECLFCNGTGIHDENNECGFCYPDKEEDK